MSLLQDIQRTGRYPRVALNVFPLSGGTGPFLSSGSFVLDHFLSYQFDQSVLVPAAAFRFTFAAPDDPEPFQKYFSEGDVVQLTANNKLISTGLIDEVEVETDADGGEMVTVTGRDLAGQLVDQDAISLDSTPIYAQNATVQAVFDRLKVDTRIRGLRLQQAPAKPYLFATEPTDRKMAALQRFLEPLNCLAWMDPDGTLVIGRPNMSASAPTANSWYLNKRARVANVQRMKATFGAALVPNVVVPIWTAQENVQHLVGKQQAIVNRSRGPNHLLQLGHRVLRTVVWSSPDGASAQDLSAINQLKVASSTLLEALAKREIARENVKELGVAVTVPGHYNDDGSPIRIDQMAKINYDRGNIDERMYCHTVSYSYDEEGGQRTMMQFCKAGSIVSDVVAQ